MLELQLNQLFDYVKDKVLETEDGQYIGIVKGKKYSEAEGAKLILDNGRSVLAESIDNGVRVKVDEEEFNEENIDNDNHDFIDENANKNEKSLTKPINLGVEMDESGIPKLAVEPGFEHLVDNTQKETNLPNRNLHKPLHKEQVQKNSPIKNNNPIISLLEKAKTETKQILVSVNVNMYDENLVNILSSNYENSGIDIGKYIVENNINKEEIFNDILKQILKTYNIQQEEIKS